MNAYEQLEIEWAEWNDLDPRGMVVCSSGTAALHLALEAPCFPSRSSVIVPDYSMIACARAVTLAGLVPEFVDCIPTDLNLDPRKVLGRIRENTGIQVVMVVHTYGRPCQVEEIRKNVGDSCHILEDLSEAHGLRPHPSSHAACWSFYKNKIVSGEEGGAVYFKDSSLAGRARSLRSLGFTENHDFRHIPRGHNYRMSNCHASLILTSLQQAHDNLRARWTVQSWFDERIKPEWKQPPREFPWVYDIRIPDLTYSLQDRVVSSLRRKGIQARHGFKPLSLQSEYQVSDIGTTVHAHPIDGRRTVNEEAFKASQQVIYLPLFPSCTRDEARSQIKEVELVNLAMIGRKP